MTVFKSVGGAKKYFKYAECEVGQVLVEGKYIGTSDNRYNPDKPNFDFKPKEGPTVCLNSAGQLNWLMGRVPVGALVRVIYEGKEPIEKGPMKGKDSHCFDVQMAEGQEQLDVKPEVKEDSKTVDLSDLD